jgi:CBS domain-containing protein
MLETYESEMTAFDRLLGTVRQAMAKDVLDLDPRMRASVAAREMEARHVSGAPVIEHGMLVGMLSMTDVMRPAEASWQTSGPFLRHEHTLAQIEVADIMTKDVVTADPDWPLSRAAMVMAATGVNRLPVVDALDRPIGIITRHDIVRMVARRGEQAENPDLQNVTT